MIKDKQNKKDNITKNHCKLDRRGFYFTHKD